jgi:hypothetical protein
VKRRQWPRDAARCECDLQHGHVPWCPAAPIATALRYSRATGCDSGRIDYADWREIRHQPAPDWWQEALEAIRGPTFEQDNQPTNFREWREPCERCGLQTLVITITQGQLVRQLDLCPCQLSPEQRAKNAAVERIWAEGAARREANVQERKITWDHQKELKRQAEECQAMMERQFPGAGCKDKAQAYPFCPGCPLKRKKRQKGDRK